MGSIQATESPSVSWGSPCPCIPQKHGAQDRSGSPQGLPSTPQSSYMPGLAPVAWHCCGKVPSVGDLPWVASLLWGARTPDLPCGTGPTGVWHFFGHRGSRVAQE